MKLIQTSDTSWANVDDITRVVKESDGRYRVSIALNSGGEMTVHLSAEVGKQLISEYCDFYLKIEV